MAYSPDEETFAPKRSPWFVRGLVVAAAAGALLIAQRNGFFHSFARAVDQEKKLEQLENKVVGSPAVDTPRGLEAKLEQIRSQNRLDELSRTEPQPSKIDAMIARDTAPTEKEKSEAAAEAAKPAASAKPEDVKNAFASALAGKPAPKKAAAPVSSARKTTRAKATGSSRANRGGNEYDPMNGTL